LINDPYTALNGILQNNTAITDLLGKYEGTDIPLIKGGVLPETETQMPCIVFYNNSLESNFNNNDSFFTVNCYAEEDRDSFLLANTVVNELKGLQTTANGYPVTVQARIITAVPSPTDREVNTAVEVRLFNIGGAI
jgi:hypothetical protein